MKAKYFLIAVCFLTLFSLTLNAQTVSMESSLKMSDSLLVPVNRWEAKDSSWQFRYDYKVGQNDVFGLSAPQIITSDKFQLGLDLIQLGDWNKYSQLIVGVTGKNQFKTWSLAWEWRHLFSKGSKLNEQLITRATGRLFTIEGMMAANDSLELYAWTAFHPDKFYVSLGWGKTKAWAVIGTKDWNNFGNLTIFDYDFQNGNFWFKSQIGLGETNQSFYSQENYDLVSSYFVLPNYFYLHFSPLSTKGRRTIKTELTRTNGQYCLELAYGNQIGKIFQASFGIISRFNGTKIETAPIIEVYKDWQLAGARAVIELRYDFLAKQLIGYTTLKYQL